MAVRVAAQPAGLVAREAPGAAVSAALAARVARRALAVRGVGAEPVASRDHRAAAFRRRPRI
jgi:hypothetical protein